MNTRLKNLGIGIVVSLVILVLPSAQAWRERMSDSPPGNTNPGWPGPANPPWREPGGFTLTPDVGVKYWVAVENAYVYTRKKIAHVTVTPPMGKDLKCNGVTGYDNAGGTASSCAGDDVDRKDNPDGTITFTVTLTPQPAWEVFEIEITNDRGGPGRDGDYDPQADGDSDCLQVGLDDVQLDLFDVTHGGPDDIFALTEFAIYPETGYVNTYAEPSFSAAPHTGQWYCQYVFHDPYGEVQPQGGVVFFTDGPGIQAQDVFGLTLPMLEYEERYWLYQFDAVEGKWEVYMLRAGDEGFPECPEDINRDGVVNLVDLAELLAAYGTSEGEPGYNPAADINRDGYVGLCDLAALLAMYGRECP